MSTPRQTCRRTPRVLVALTTLAVAGLLAPAAAAEPRAAAAPAAADRDATFRGEVHVVRGQDRTPRRLEGTVFDDADRDSRQDPGERGLPGVSVSNGRQVVTTDRQGRYTLPVSDNTTVSVVQPRGWQVPVDDANIAQFFYNHLPAGSPPLRYGGLEPTGALPAAVNFPLVRSAATASADQRCVMAADVQTYTEQEAEYARAGTFGDLAGRTDHRGCGVLMVGDLVGDDLSIFERTRALTSMLNGPARALPGNHDLDYDSPSAEHNFDTYRSEFGPTHYSYDVGRAHVVALQTVEYPTQTPPAMSSYRGAIDPEQLAWLRRDLARVPEDRLVVLAGHIPLLETYYSPSHQIRGLAKLYRLLEGRTVVSVSGHTHMIENLREGDLLAGWKDVLGDDGLPFDHLVAGAVSGHWYAGRMLPEGYPTAIMRDGAHPGVMTLELDGTRFTESYDVRGPGRGPSLSLGLNTPAYRDWFADNQAAARSNSREAAVRPRATATRGTPPPARVVTRRDLRGGSWLTSNVFLGTSASSVRVRMTGPDGRPGRWQDAEHTQPMQGEPLRVGAEWSDPTANRETMVHGGGLVDRTSHLWRLALPEDLVSGRHVAQVRTVDRHGRASSRSMTFRVR
ncbi:calcineurin-like phosphoesterase family protein [uncultured Nocardioides sp.]|uniref:calcineurin-like phosphoesterase family protein n=1 Tax=uncultured Nocardioides sp. TaxID=198441 RepID=UPI002634B4CC|nr:calcineurin-like phosphoesterase family protein [uncultured Nocardioides sp.]